MIDWQNWKTGVKIGFGYGLICALYFFVPVLFSQVFPPPDQPIMMCDDTCTSFYKYLGFLVFFPLLILSVFFWSRTDYQTLPVYQVILMNSIILILLGTALGAAFGHFCGWIDKKKVIIKISPQTDMNQVGK